MLGEAWLSIVSRCVPKRTLPGLPGTRSSPSVSSRHAAIETELEGCFKSLSGNPRLGRSAELLAPGLRRFEHRSHTVFYTEDVYGVLIVRILHAGMDAPRHL